MRPPLETTELASVSATYEGGRELRTAVVRWRQGPDTWLCTLVCKATFHVEAAGLTLAKDQEPIARTDTHWDDDPKRSLASFSDLVPWKSHVDVVLVGHAFAPEAKPTRSVMSRLALGSIDKTVHVLADRSAGPDGAILHGPKFTQMPLVYERAYGGPRTWNPVGLRAGARDAYGRVNLPNFVVPGEGAPQDPTGFGPIAPQWPGRLEKLGRLAPTFRHADWSEEPLVEGFPFGYFNVAPPDQQLEAIPEGARLTLEHLHRSAPQVVAPLPSIVGSAALGGRRSGEAAVMRLDTLLVDTDRALLTATWRGRLKLGHPSEEIRAAITFSSRRPAEPTQTHEDPMFATHDTREPPGADPVTATHRAVTSAASSGLPFARGATAGAAPSGGLPFTRGKTAPPPASQPEARRPPEPPRQLGHLAPEQRPVPFPAPASEPAWSAAAPPTGRPFAAGSPAPQAWAPAPAPPARVGHAAVAAVGGVVAASNAATSQPTPASSAARPQARRAVGDVLDLVWFDPSVTPRVKQNPDWKRLVDELEQVAFDPELDAVHAGDADVDVDDRREVFEVLTRGAPSGPERIDDALVEAVRADGRFAPRLLLIAGELAFEFDELEVLKATIAAAKPLGVPDDDLAKSVERASAFLRSPGLICSADVARGYTRKIRDAFQGTPRLVAPTYLDEQTERVLLERRAYQRKSVFGEPHLRSALYFPGMDAPVPSYLPVDLASKLPLFRRIKVRILVEAHPPEDQHEEHRAAFKAMAVARVLRS